MAYVTQTDVERAAGGAAKLAQLTDLDADGAVDALVLSETIADASRWIDSYVQRRHAVPLTEPVPAIVRRFCAQEVVYLLKRPRGAVDTQDQEDHDELLLWLRGVSEGSVSLGVDPPPTHSSSVRPESGDREDVDSAATRDTLKGLW
jgi:phage gp36-like protein